MPSFNLRFKLIKDENREMVLKLKDEIEIETVKLKDGLRFRNLLSLIQSHILVLF